MNAKHWIGIACAMIASAGCATGEAVRDHELPLVTRADVDGLYSDDGCSELRAASTGVTEVRVVDDEHLVAVVWDGVVACVYDGGLLAPTDLPDADFGEPLAPFQTLGTQTSETDEEPHPEPADPGFTNEPHPEPATPTRPLPVSPY